MIFSRVMGWVDAHYGTFALFAAVVSFCPACATTSDIYLTHDRMVTGQVVATDSKQIFVRREVRDGGMTYVSGNEMAIPKNQITTIDHPGNVMLVVGLITTVAGVLILAGHSDGCGAFTMEIPCQASHAPFVAGVGMSLWGLGVWANSYGKSEASRARASRRGGSPRLR
jgi:hypothetical protein